MNDELNSMWMAMKDTQYARKLQELRQSFEISTNVDETFVKTLNTVVDAVHAQTGTFWYYDRMGDGRIYPKAVYKGESFGDFSMAPGEGVVGQVVESKKATMIEDCQKDPRWAGKVDAKTGFSTKTMICIPLIVEDNVLGAIQIINKTDDNNFDNKDMDFLEQLLKDIANMMAHQLLLSIYVGYKSSKMVMIPEYKLFSDLFGLKDDKDTEALFEMLCTGKNLSLDKKIKLQHHARKIAELLKD